MVAGRKLVTGALVLASAAGVAYCSWGFVAAESRVRALCGQIRPGMSIAEARQIARIHGMSPAPKETGISFMAEERTFGRFGCRITAEAGVVKEAVYSFAD